MPEQSLMLDALRNIEESLLHIIDRTSTIKTANDFCVTPTGVDLLDIVAIRLLAIGEEIKKIEKRTEGKLLAQYPGIEWRDVMGMRDFIAHAYFRIDAAVIFDTLKNNVPPLLATIQQMIADLAQDNCSSD